VAVWVVPNLDHYHLDASGPLFSRQNAGHVPDNYNHAWRDYGPRVGIWRQMALFDRYGIRVTAALNAEVCDHYPLLVAEGLKRGWEFIGHGLSSSHALAGLAEADERAVIEGTLDRIARATGQRPRGWLSPSLAETPRTPELLAAAGVDWVADWCADDQPFALRVAGGSLLALPYTVELNDIPLCLHQAQTGQAFYAAVRDQFDVLYREGAASGRVLCISVHPFVTGQPHRSRYLEQALAYVTGHPYVWLATGSEIADAYRAQAR
jgi:peptidoglycan/xylan/chitin deacetylase (PgdA/CDA1 family)